MSLNREEYFRQVKSEDFEEAIRARVSAFLVQTYRHVPVPPSEVILRYVTHIFAKQLDEIAEYVVKPKTVN